MSKGEVLALLNACLAKGDKALLRTDLTIAQRKEIEGTIALIKRYEKHIKDNVKETDTEALTKYHTQFSGVLQNFKELAAPRSIMARPENAVVKTKVKAIVPEEEQSKELKEERKKAWELIKNILAALGAIAVVAALIAALALGLKSCSNEKGKEELDNDTKPGFEQTQDNTISIGDLDIEDYTSLMRHSEAIQHALGETDLSIEEIMYAIRLGNFDSLEDKAIFKDRDEVYNGTKVLGEVATALGSDSVIQKDANTDIFVTEAELVDIIMCVTDNKLSIDDFAKAKVDGKGYDIYALADVCTKGISNNTEKDVLFAKVFNDILARKVAAFTITPNSPISTYYTLLGMYNANSKRLLELTSGIGLTSVYGDGTRIDGYYGFICVEELEAFLQIGNEENVFYTVIIDENITNYSQDQTLGR